MDYHLIILAFALLFGIVRFLYRSAKWVARQSKGLPTGPNPVQQALAEARRGAIGPPKSVTPRAASPGQPSPVPLSQPARPPETAGADAATEADFQRREQELQAESERAAAYFRRRAEELRAEKREAGRVLPTVALSAEAQAAPTAQLPSRSSGPKARLFGRSDDLVRAFILREALGPPLSRRARPAPPRNPSA